MVRAESCAAQISGVAGLAWGVDQVKSVFPCAAPAISFFKYFASAVGSLWFRSNPAPPRRGCCDRLREVLQVTGRGASRGANPARPVALPPPLRAPRFIRMAPSALASKRASVLQEAAKQRGKVVLRGGYGGSNRCQTLGIVGARMVWPNFPGLVKPTTLFPVAVTASKP